MSAISAGPRDQQDTVWGPRAVRRHTALRSSTPRLALVLLACGVCAFTVLALRALHGPALPTAATPAQVSRQPVAAAAHGAVGLRQLEALPVAAQTVISRTLGANEPGYAVRHTTSGLQFAGAGLTAAFTRGGARITTPDGALTMSMEAVGRGARMQRVAAVTPTGRANRVLYRDRPADQSYVNGPLGLEQGFTVTHRPSGAAGPLTIAIRLGGDLLPATIDGGHALAFRATDGRNVLRYGGLRVTDARGRILPAGLVLSHGRLLIQVIDRGAGYPLTVDPTLTTEITDPGDTNGDFFGESVAISGSTIVVGSSSYGNNAAGLVYVFTSGSAGWTQAAVLNPPSNGSGPQEGDGFGDSVAISGSTIVVGVPWLQGGETANGGVAVFVEPPGGWASEPSESRTVLIEASTTSSGEELGYSVAMSGSTIVAGSPDTGPYTTDGCSSCVANGDGAVYVWTEPTNGWASESPSPGSPAYPAPAAMFSGGAGSALGTSVAMDIPAGSSEGTIVAGEPEENTYSGAVVVYTGSGSSWTQQATLDGANTDDELGGEPAVGNVSPGPGTGVAISGGTIVAGAPGATGGGAAYVFTRSGSSWSSGAALAGPSDWTGPALGESVAISGTTVLVGDPQADSGNGAAFEISEPPGGWVPGNMSASDELTPPGSAGAQDFGTGLAISGSLVVATAPGTPITSQPGHNAGAVFLNQTGVAQAPPTLAITGPANGAVLHNSTVTVTGTASDSIGLSSVTVDGTPVAVTSGAFSTSVTLTPGSNAITAVATGTDSQTTTRQVTVTYTPSSPGGGPGSAPVLGGLSLTNHRFAVAAFNTPISLRTTPRGTAFGFTLSATATVTIKIEQSDRGLRTGARCVAPTARLRSKHARSCTRVVLIGTLTRRNEPSGRDTVAFSGRIGSKALRPGSYGAIVAATDSVGASKPANTTFTIVS